MTRKKKLQENPKKRTVDFHIILTPPDIPLGPGIGKHRVNLKKKLTLDFVPTAGLSFILMGDFAEEKTHLWSPLIGASGGPKGAVGLALNSDIWQVDRVFYDLTEKRFILNCFPELETREQFEAIPKLLCGFHGFRIHYSLPRKKLKARTETGV
ncbi:MAG: hypothetical protein M3Y13_05585 [Armatimonadota bacterium]|nr:hypothetical protein [Armatimonadota bacterium]